MFTGIVQELGEVTESNQTSSGISIKICVTSSFTENLKKGASVSVNGVCLTVVNSNDTNIIDLRDTSELIENGIIPGSMHTSRGHLEFFADPKCEYYKDFFDKNKNNSSLDRLLHAKTAAKSSWLCSLL